MKKVAQLNEEGYFVGVTYADKSPLEEDVYHIPSNAIDVNIPTVPEGKRAKWNNGWVFEDIPPVKPDETLEEPVVVEEEPNFEVDFDSLTYAQKRQIEYPYIGEYVDGIVKGDQAQIDKYIADCLAVKAKYPKE